MPSIRHALTFVPLIALAGCASKPESDAAYVSPTQYDSYNCSQMKAEMKRLNSQIDQLQKRDTSTQLMNTALSVYAITQGYGMSDDGDDNVELRRAQNKYRLADEMMVNKNCTD